MSKPRTNWTETPLVFVERPACPHCGSVKYDKLKTLNGGSDGSSTKRVRCRDCNEPYQIVFELPESGEHVIWPE